jgi:hypothetical protein
MEHKESYVPYLPMQICGVISSYFCKEELTIYRDIMNDTETELDYNIILFIIKSNWVHMYDRAIKSIHIPLEDKSLELLEVAVKMENIGFLDVIFHKNMYDSKSIKHLLNYAIELQLTGPISYIIHIHNKTMNSSNEFMVHYALENAINKKLYISINCIASTFNCLKYINGGIIYATSYGNIETLRILYEVRCTFIDFVKKYIYPNSKAVAVIKLQNNFEDGDLVASIRDAKQYRRYDIIDLIQSWIEKDGSGIVNLE